MTQVLTPQESILVTVKKSVWVEMGLPCRPKSRIIIVQIHLIQQLVIGVKCFHRDCSFLIQTSGRMIQSGCHHPHGKYTDTEAGAVLLFGIAPEPEPAAHR